VKTFVVHGKTIGTDDGSHDLPKVAVRLEETQVLSLLSRKTVSNVNLDEDARRVTEWVIVNWVRTQGNERVISQDRLGDSPSFDPEIFMYGNSWNGSTRL
jgi:hypothetical protein